MKEFFMFRASHPRVVLQRDPSKASKDIVHVSEYDFMDLHRRKKLSITMRLLRRPWSCTTALEERWTIITSNEKS